jgi:hypothetical protein
MTGGIRNGSSSERYSHRRESFRSVSTAFGVGRAAATTGWWCGDGEEDDGGGDGGCGRTRVGIRLDGTIRIWRGADAGTGPVRQILFRQLLRNPLTMGMMMPGGGRKEWTNHHGQRAATRKNKRRREPSSPCSFMMLNPFFANLLRQQCRLPAVRTTRKKRSSAKLQQNRKNVF